MVPVFEFQDGPRHYKIFSDGRVEGGANVGIVINRAGIVLHYAITSSKQLGHTLQARLLEKFGS